MIATSLGRIDVTQNAPASPRRATPGVSLGSAAEFRFSGVRLDDISVRRAASDRDLAIVAALRRTGFSRVIDADLSPVNWLEPLDRDSAAFSLIASVGGVDVGTMRIQDGRVRALELGSCVDLVAYESLIATPLTQFSRLSVVKAPRRYDAMFGLFKAAWRWAYAEGLRSIVIGTPRWSKPIYTFMCFQSLGDAARFAHPLAPAATHETMTLPVREAEHLWRQANQPLCEQFFDIWHPRLHI